MTFSIDSKTNRVIDVNGKILCIQYGEDADVNLLKTCSNNMLNDPEYNLVSCEQTRDRKLKCSVPVKECTVGITFETTCVTLPGRFNNFYTFSGRNDGIFLAMAGTTNPGANYQAVELVITPNESKWAA
ncbi:hypothetical protein DER46DRAFT_580511 [Fusarium sp. MPI-SDFR-AT-0072]|nr:hypothetical protein DER46DRAFT_580511 [Fusarium sp. MPI-SDFR-AT-0072]